MRFEIENVCSLTDFQKQTKKHLRRLKKSGQPEVLTLNGQAEVVVQSAKGYQELLDRADLSDSVQILRRRIASRRENDVPAEKFLTAVREKLGLKATR